MKKQSTNKQKGVREMRTVYRRRRIGALLLFLMILASLGKMTQMAFTDDPLNCGIPAVKVLLIEKVNEADRPENHWHIAQRMCKNEQHRLDEVVYWMIQHNGPEHPRAGQYIKLPYMRGEK